MPAEFPLLCPALRMEKGDADRQGDEAPFCLSYLPILIMYTADIFLNYICCVVI